MSTLNNTYIHEIIPLSDKDCIYITNRKDKNEFDYPLHSHSEYEIVFLDGASGVTSIVGDSTEIIGDYDMILVTGEYLEHAYMQNAQLSKPAHEIVIQFSQQLIDNTLLFLNQFKAIEKLFDDDTRRVAVSHNAFSLVYRA